MGRSISKVVWWSCRLVLLVLAFACLPMHAATSANNRATIAAPAGVIDPAGGCNTNSPPDCTGNNTSTATVNVWAVTVAKSASPGNGSTVLAGQTLSYTLTATVTGAATATSTVFTDTLGANLSFGSVTTPGVFTAGGAGQARTFTLPAGTVAGTYSVVYTATVNAGATGTAGNSVTGGAGCTAPGNCTTSHPIGSVGVSKALTAESGSQAGIAEAGETLTYTITLSNPSTVVVNNFNLTDTLSAGLSYVSSSNAGVNAGQSTTWTNLTVPANGTLSVTVVASVNTPVAAASVSNLARPTGEPDPVCPSTSCVVTSTTSAVTIAKSSTPANGSTVLPGQTLTYTLTATVAGAATGTPTVFFDTLGTNLTFGAVTTPGVFVAGGAGQNRTFTLPAGTVAGTYTVVYTATVNAGATGAAGNSVMGGAGCTTPGNCTTSHPIGAVGVAKALTGESGSQAGIAEAGETLIYTITLSNPSTVSVTNFNLTDTLSAGLTHVSSSNGGVNAGQSTTWTNLTVPANGTLGVTLVATVNSPISTATISNLARPTGEPDPVCPSAGCVVTPTTSTVTVAKGAAPANGSTVLPGQTLSYTLTATVTGASSGAPTTFTDTLGANLTFGSVTTPGVFVAGGAGQNRTFTLPAGTAAGTYAVTYTATVNVGATGAAGNSVAGGAGCTTPGNCTTSHPIGSVGVAKALTAESGGQPGVAEAGETLTYTITLTNPGALAVTGFGLTDTLGAGLSHVSSTPAGVNAGQTTTWSGLTIPANGSLSVTLTARVNTPIAQASVRNLAKPTGLPDPACPGAACVVTPTEARVAALKLLSAESGTQPGTAEPGETLTYTIRLTNTGGTAFSNYRLTENVPLGATLVGVSGATGFGGPVTGPGSLNLTVPSVPAAGVALLTVQFQVATQVPGGLATLPNLINGGDIDPLCASACSVSIPLGNPVALGLVKTAAVREARIGDLVRYSVRVSNAGAVAVSNASVVDTPPPGFSYVVGSMSVADADGAFTLGAGQSPLHIGGIDIAPGRDAVITYLLRVGAGVRQGLHVNQAQAQNSQGHPISNPASAQVQVMADPLLDESLILGTVFDDRDGDGWQDPAHLSGVRVQGGFSPAAYLAGSTTVDRGQGPQPQSDASAPLLKGIALGKVSARQSVADPAANHQVVVRQRVNELAFTDDFVLTSDQGITVRMNAAGQTATEASGEAAKGLNGAAPTVERRIAKVEGGYEVAYVVRNDGIDERGIPGVRIASVEGLLIESDLFGRFNLTGIAGGDAARGRNFILKIDPSTLPDGAALTTANPLVRRITPGLPARFDFGVKLPEQPLSGGREQIDVELGEVLFEPGSAEIRQEHEPVIARMVAKVHAYGGGELVIRAHGESDALALGRAQALDQAMALLLTPDVAKATRVSVRTEVGDPGSLVVGVQQGRLVLGTVLFDTDQALIRPPYRALLAEVARQLGQLHGGAIGLVGHADRRASDAHNLALGLRRAQAVYQTLVDELPPEARAKVRIEILPDAPHGVRLGQAAGHTR